MVKSESPKVKALADDVRSILSGLVVPVEHGEVAVPETPKSEPGKAAVLNRSIRLSEVMYNELLFSQVKQEATHMGLTVATNKSRVDDAS